MAIITDPYMARIIDLVRADILYVGIGIGAAPTNIDYQLQNEQLRKTCTELIDGLTIVKEGYWDETEGNGTHFTNAAIFGNGATPAVGSGTVAVGDAIDIVKDNTQGLTVSIELTFEVINE